MGQETFNTAASSEAPGNPGLAELLQAYPLQGVDTPMGRIQYRQAGPDGAAQTLVLLHGIGSASASWLAQLQAASAQPNLASAFRVLAWDAPGYGLSQPISNPEPRAADYAQRLWAWLNVLGLQGAVTLVGHSLGAIMAAAAARQAPQRVQRLVLLAPARGYARSSAEEREQKRADRLNNLAVLGPAGMAQKRGAAMLSPQATPAQIGFVQGIMAQVNPGGYTQATHLLAQADLLADLPFCQSPVVVASGSADTITPPSACKEVAATAQVEWQDLGPVGHACALEAASRVNTLLGLPAGELS